MSTIAPYVIAMAVGFPASLFGYLRYRSYIGLAKVVVEKKGPEGLKAMEHIAAPWRSPARLQLGRKQATADREPAQLRGVA